MKKGMLKICAVLSCSLWLWSCSGTPDKSKVTTTDKFVVSGVSVTLSQSREPDIEYHSQAEIEGLFSKKINEKLKGYNLLSDDNSSNALDIKIKYHRQFMGDQSPVPSDSLRGPAVSYEIYVKNGEKLLATLSEEKFEYVGGMGLRLKLLAGQLRSKSEEDALVDGLSEMVAEKIKRMKN